MPASTEAVRPKGFLRLFAVFHESEALGAGRSVLRAVDSLRGYGWTVSGWFPEEGALLDEAGGSIPFEAYASKPIRYSMRGWRDEPGVVARLRETPSYLRRFREALLRAQPHVVHANTLRTLPEAAVARRLGLPVVVHVHELPPPSTKRALVLRAAARTADVLVAVSEAAAELLRPYAGRTPVLVAYNGVPARAEARVAETSATVGTIGTVAHTKGTDVFVEAAAIARRRCPELRFEHIGQSGLAGDAEFERRVVRLAEDESVRDHLEFLGRRPAEDGLDRWELFVLPSRQDAFPLASLEAMSARVPVIATKVGGIPEQIEHLESGVLVEPENSNELADWIVRLHQDGQLRGRLAEAAAQRVEERFTLERQGTALHGAYLAALNLRHGPPPVRERTLETV